MDVSINVSELRSFTLRNFIEDAGRMLLYPPELRSFTLRNFIEEMENTRPH